MRRNGVALIGTLAAATVALIGMAGAMAACSNSRATDGAAPPDASTRPDFDFEEVSVADCHAYDPPADLDAMNETLATAASINGLVGGDIGTGVRLPDGEIMFAFGDSLLDTPISTRGSVRNSMLTGDGGQGCLVLGPGGGAFVPDRIDGVGYWPMSMVSLPDHPSADVAMFVNRVKGTGRLGEFVNLGPGIARLAVDDSGVPHVQEVVDIGPDDASMSRITWGAASWADDSGHVYIYGTSNPGVDLVFGWALHAARAPVREVFDPNAWEYWDGRSWSPDPLAAIALIPANGGVSQTLSVFSQGGTWYAVSKQDDFWGDRVVIWSAPGPLGPFQPTQVAGYKPSDPEDGLLQYTALAHPTLFPEPGTIVLSISVNSNDPDVIAEDPTLYRPHFWRSALP